MTDTPKNPHAQALGKLGGLARKTKLSQERRQEIARTAGKAPKKPRKRPQKPL